MDTSEQTTKDTHERRKRLLGPDVRRRPSGEAPPLPRNLGRSGKFWLFMVGYFVATLIGVLLFEPMARLYERTDTSFLHLLAEGRNDILTEIMQAVALLASRWVIRVLRWGTIVALIATRRWRHLFVFLGALITEEVVAYLLTFVIHRPRPLGVEILAPWQGFSMPSRPMASLAVTLVGMAYSLIPHGRYRDAAKWAIGGILVGVGFARLYLGVEAASACIFGGVLGVAIGLTAFRWFTPNDVFPVTYKKGKAAHLDVGGMRGEAIVTAVRDQLGYRVLDIQPVGLAGSGGSTPLRLKVRSEEGGPERQLFAKLYAQNHVRADRWYKIGRTILYGALEDETPFGTVRRFVEYEDYALRLMYDLDLPVPTPYGIVEITPEREYMIVMEFFDGAVEIGEAEIDDGVIEQGLQLVREMWDEGLAHRDVKPANLMVRDGAAEADRCLLRPGSSVTVAPGGRPGEHDDGARPPLGRAARVRTRRRAVLPGRDRRGVRRHPRGRQPHPAAFDDEGRRPRPARGVPGARPRPRRGAHPTVEPPSGGPDRHGAARRSCSCSG